MRWYLTKTPKRPPPAHGLKMKKAGKTWWGQRWIGALEQVLGADANRLSRGRTYARTGRAHDLVVANGAVAAKVTGTRPRPYVVTLSLVQLDDATWSRVIGGMASQAAFSAALLAGEMPKEIDTVFREAGARLFPTSRADLRTHCSCPDTADLCKHVAATHYLLGEALDADPFLLFELRGRPKEAVLEALRAARGSAGSVAEGAVTIEATIPYDEPREPLPNLSFTFDPPAADAAVLRQLGTVGGSSPAEDLAPLLRAAAEAARAMALED